MDLIRASSLGIDYTPLLFTERELQESNVYTLRGPRRVGKTTALKLLIKSLIENGIFDPCSIVWVTAETCRTLKQLDELLRKALARPAGIPPRLICIDEITAVSQWQRVLKQLRDTDPASHNACWICTGSSALDIRRGAERLPGRRRSLTSATLSLDRVLLPMSFPAFVTATRPPPAEALSNYLRYGGYPLLAAASLAGQQHLWEVRIAELRDAVISEFERRKLARTILLELLDALARQGATATSWEAFAKQFSSATRDTVRLYVEAAGESFLLATYWSFDTGRNRVALKKDRKLLWMDPALFMMSANLHRDLEATVAEAVVGVKLLRDNDPALFEGAHQSCAVYTWKSKAGREVDFLVVKGARRFPVEVKWQDQVSLWDLVSLEQAFKGGICVAKRDHPIGTNARVLSLENFLRGESIPFVT